MEKREGSHGWWSVSVTPALKRLGEENHHVFETRFQSQTAFQLVLLAEESKGTWRGHQEESPGTKYPSLYLYNSPVTLLPLPT